MNRRTAVLGAALGLAFGSGGLLLVHRLLVTVTTGDVLLSLAVVMPAAVLLALLARTVRRRAGLAAAIICLVPGVWLLGDGLHALLMHRAYARWEAGITRDADGVREGCREYTLGEGKTAVLLLHGFANSPSEYQRMAPALAARGYTCRVMRLPHFAMPMDRYRESTAAGWREALADELSRLRARHSRVVVVAHSLGGAVALDYLLDRPEAADRLVLLAPLLDVSGRRSPLLSPRQWFLVLDHSLVFTDFVHTPFKSDLKDRAAVPLTRKDRFIPRAIYRELFPLLERNRARADRSRLPLLVVLAEDDPVTDGAAAERLYEGCGSKPKRLVWLANSSHLIPMDAEWERVVEEVDAFAR